MAINIANNIGDSIVLDGVPYVLVGPEQKAPDTVFPSAAPGSDLYNIYGGQFTDIDPTGKKGYTAEEVAIALADPYHSRTAISCIQGIQTTIYTAPADGVIRFFTDAQFVREANIFVNDTLVKGNVPIGQVIYSPGTDGGDMSQYINIGIGGGALFSANQPVLMGAGDVLKITMLGATRNIWYMFLPNTYPAPPPPP